MSEKKQGDNPDRPLTDLPRPDTGVDTTEPDAQEVRGGRQVVDESAAAQGIRLPGPIGGN